MVRLLEGWRPSRAEWGAVLVFLCEAAEKLRRWATLAQTAEKDATKLIAAARHKPLQAAAGLA